LILLPIYPAREKPIAGVDSVMILDKVSLKKKQLTSMEKLVDELDNHFFDVLLTIGAGDIDLLVKPIETHLHERSKMMTT
jgi:UDP-N-acetylmuramate--alanine ligase